MPNSRISFRPVARGPLNGLKETYDQFELKALPLSDKLILRGEHDSPYFVKEIKKVVGLPIPLTVGEITSDGKRSMLRLGPDETLLCLELEETNLEINDVLFKVSLIGKTNVSDYYIDLQLKGPRVCEILAKGCSLDFHLSVFPVNTCAQAAIQQAPVILWRTESQTFRIFVRWSLAEYLYKLLRTLAV